MQLSETSQFAVVRCYEGAGHVDPNAPGTVKAAGASAPPSSGSGASAPPSSGSGAGIRGAVAAYAASIAGTSACSKRLEYMSLIAPGETLSVQADMCTMSSCGLAVALSSSLGTEHGSAAAAAAVAIGFPMCVNVWLLLDNIPSSTGGSDLVGYYNAWYAAVVQAGFLPGLRVGPSEVLDGQALGDLAFCHYWQSSGVSVTPSPRGYQLTDGGAANVVAGVALSAVTAQNDAGEGSQGPGQAEWLIATPR